MTTCIDQYGRTRVTLASERDPHKTIELSGENWAATGYPVTVEDAYERMGTVKADESDWLSSEGRYGHHN